jgi:superfamily II DNA or RNA helicase
MSASATQPTIRPYQQQAIVACLDALAKSVNPLLVAPTGAGKTVMASEIMRRWQEKHNQTCFFFAHRSELLEQAQATMDRAGVKGVALSVFQKDFSSHSGREGGLCIFDEAHHAVASSWKFVQSQFHGPAVAITATPDRMDKQRIQSAGFTEVFQISIRDLIKQGYLVRPMAQKLAVSICDNILESHDDALTMTARSVVDEFYRYGRKKAMVFLPSVECSRRFSAELRAIGMSSSHLDGTSGKLRSIAVDAFKKGESQFLCNVALFTEGFDCPDVDCVILLRETKSRALWSQMIGRGLRSHPGKTDCLILDPMWVSGIHSLQPADAFTEHPDAQGKAVPGLSDPLSEAQTEDDAAEDRLLRRLKKAQAAKDAKDAHARGLVDLSMVEPLFGFVPPPSDSQDLITVFQRNELERYQIHAPATMTREAAYYIIEKMRERQRLNLATVRQVKKLRQFGHRLAGSYTFEQASKAIATDWRIAGRAKFRKTFK